MILKIIAIVSILFLVFKFAKGSKKKKKRKKNVKKGTHKISKDVASSAIEHQNLNDGTDSDAADSQVENVNSQSETVDTIDSLSEAIDSSSEILKPTVLVIKSNSIKATPKVSTKKNVDTTLTKKQRQNLRRKELEKSIKNENDLIQRQRLEKYRKEQEKEALKNLIKKY